MKDKFNPYAVAFGRIPTSFINRDIIVDEIFSAFNSEYVDSQCFKLTGVRGSGKTVTMTSISKKLSADDRWIIADLSSSENIVQDLLAIIYDKVPFLSQFIDAELNLSAFGIGIKLHKKPPVASPDVALSKVLDAIKDKNKRLLITIDEIHKTDNIIHFVKFFQQMMREEQPLYLLSAGLHGKVEELENTEGLTFFYRAPKRKMTPLNVTLMKLDYQQKLGVTPEVAETMAYLTKGYAFAYQALGKYMWEADAKDITDEILIKVDAALADGSYDIIWRELSETERFYIKFLCQKDKMDVSELLELTKKKASDWSRPRKNLMDKELIQASSRGVVEFMLPRFSHYIENVI